MVEGVQNVANVMILARTVHICCDTKISVFKNIIKVTHESFWRRSKINFFPFFYLSTFRPSSQSLDTPGHSNRKKKASQIGTSVTLFFYSLLSGIDQKIKEKKKRIDTQKKNLMRKSILLPMTCLFSLPFYGRSRALNGMLIHLTPIEDNFFLLLSVFRVIKESFFERRQ